MNLNDLLPVFRTSLSQNETWSAGTLLHPVRFRAELSSLQASLASGAFRKSIPPPTHPSLSKCKNATYDSFSRGTTSFTLASTLSYMPMGPVWISAGFSSSIRNWLNVMPYVGTKPEIL